MLVSFQPRLKFFKHTWLCEFVPLLLLYLTTTFSFSQVHRQIDQNVKCIIIMRIEAFRFGYANILRESLKIISLFPPSFGRPKASTFCSRGVPGRLDALLAKSLTQASNLAAATGRRCPACWPLCPRNILKSTASSGLPSTPDYST